MAAKRIRTPAASITLNTEAVDRLLYRGSGNAALLYLYILRKSGLFREEDAARELGLSPGELQRALELLAEDGLIEAEALQENRDPATPEELQPYTTRDVLEQMAGNPDFKALLRAVEAAMGKPLSSADTERLFGIYDQLSLPPEVILFLVNHCIREIRRQNGPGRLPTLRYIEKAACDWKQEGIVSYEMAEAHVKEREALLGAEHPFAAALGITGRQLTATERGYVDAWLRLGFREDAAALAYDRTVTGTGRLSWKYMDAIFKSWHQKKLHTAAEILKGDGRGKKAAPSEDGREETVSQEELDRMKSYL